MQHTSHFLRGWRIPIPARFTLKNAGAEAAHHNKQHSFCSLLLTREEAVVNKILICPEPIQWQIQENVSIFQLFFLWMAEFTTFLRMEKKWHFESHKIFSKPCVPCGWPVYYKLRFSSANETLKGVNRIGARVFHAFLWSYFSHSNK